jgi:hypothetical protein
MGDISADNLAKAFEMIYLFDNTSVDMQKSAGGGANNYYSLVDFVATSVKEKGGYYKIVDAMQNNIPVSDEDYDLARKAIVWNNSGRMALKDVITRYEAHYAERIVEEYLKSLNPVIVAPPLAIAKVDVEYKVGVKYDLGRLNLYLCRNLGRNKYGGVTWLLKFRNSSGKVFTWFTGHGFNLGEYTVRAEIKANNVYRGEPDTIITYTQLEK